MWCFQSVIYVIAMRVLGAASEIKISELIGALIMIGGFVAFVVWTEPLEAKVAHHLPIGATLGSVILTCVSLTTMKVAAQVYELPK